VKDEEEERKKERKRRKQGKGSEAYWRANHVEWTGVTESRHVKQRDYGNMTESCHIRGARLWQHDSCHMAGTMPRWSLVTPV
jgi:hypothetical protein